MPPRVMPTQAVLWHLLSCCWPVQSCRAHQLSGPAQEPTGLLNLVGLGLRLPPAVPPRRRVDLVSPPVDPVGDSSSAGRSSLGTFELALDMADTERAGELPCMHCVATRRGI